MKKMIAFAFICILIPVGFISADWTGWVKHTTGEHAAKYTQVTAKQDTAANSVTVGYTGRGYCMGEPEGMEVGRFYTLVWATDDGHRGWVGGGVYTTDWQTKNITLDDAAWPEE